MDGYINLVDLQRDVRDGLAGLFPESVWVLAEVASIQVRGNGHCYLDLCQSVNGKICAKAKAIIWSSVYPMLSAYWKKATGGPISEGSQLIARARVNYSELYGLSLIIEDLEAQYEMGDAELKRQQTIARLREEGLIDRQQELEMVALPYRLAVISAPDAAGYGDFCRHLLENEFGFAFKVDLFPATMQGESAPASICDAIDQVECMNAECPSLPCDAILILRGGGAKLDLVCFDDYALAFSIANCPIPVFTAVGHDRDFHVVDMVAHDFVKTPTALADLFLDFYKAEDERLSAYANRLKLAFTHRLMAEESRVSMALLRIKNADPREILNRGYSLAVDQRKAVIRSVSAVSEGEMVEVMLADGVITAKIEKISKKI